MLHDTVLLFRYYDYTTFLSTNLISPGLMASSLLRIPHCECDYSLTLLSSTFTK